MLGRERHRTGVIRVEHQGGRSFDHLKHPDQLDRSDAEFVQQEEPGGSFRRRRQQDRHDGSSARCQGGREGQTRHTQSGKSRPPKLARLAG